MSELRISKTYKRHSTGELKVLLVEDNPTDVDLLHELIDRVKQCKFEVHHAETLGEASKFLEVGSFDVMLLDLSLPDSEISQTLDRLRNAMSSIATIILTGLEDDELITKALHNGAEDYLVKGRLNAEFLWRSINYSVQRKQWKREIQETQERFELAVSGSNEGYWDWKIQSDEVFYSLRCKQLLGYDGAELPNAFKSWSSSVHPGDFDRVMEALANHLAEGEPYDVELRMRKKGGKYSWFSIRGQAIRDNNGRPVRMAGTIRDISDQREAETHLRENLLLKQREEFMALLSHDLKNPLIAANLVLDAMVKGELGVLTYEQTQILSQLVDSNKYLISMMQNLIDLYRYGKSDYNLGSGQMDLAGVVRDAVADWKPVAAVIGITINNDMPLHSVEIYGDARAIRRALNNLLNNSIKFTPSGGKIEVTLSEKNGDALVKVRDTGMGMSKEVLDNLFRPFSRSNEAGSFCGGSGLGLYVTRQIIESHGGTIKCESRVEHGTVFTLLLPRNNGETGKSESVESSSTSDRIAIA